MGDVIMATVAIATVATKISEVGQKENMQCLATKFNFQKSCSFCVKQWKQKGYERKVSVIVFLSIERVSYIPLSFPELKWTEVNLTPT